MEDYQVLLGRVRAGTANSNDLQAIGLKLAEQAKGSKREALQRIALLGQEVQKKIIIGEYVFRDGTLLLTGKAATAGKKIELLQSHQQPTKGYRNVAGSGLPQNQPFVVTGIQMLSGVNAAAGESLDDNTCNAEAAATDFAVLSTVLRNGLLTIKANNQPIVTEQSMNVFNTTGMNTRTGFWQLDSPFIIPDAQGLEVFIDTFSDVAAKTFVRLNLYGQRLSPKAV